MRGPGGDRPPAGQPGATVVQVVPGGMTTDSPVRWKFEYSASQPLAAVSASSVMSKSWAIDVGLSPSLTT